MNIFQSIWDGYNNSLVQNITQNVSAGLSAVAGVMQAALGLYVIITGGLMLFMGMSWDAGIRRIIRALLVAAALTPANYNAWVVQFFTQGLPNWIAQSVGQKGGDAAAFDVLYTKVVNIASNLRTQATGLSYIGTRIEIGLAATFCELNIIIGFAIWFLSKVIMGLIVCIGPFVIPLYLFDATKGVPERWIGKLVDYAILILLVLVTLQIVQSQDTSLLALANASGMDNVDMAVQVLWNIFAVFTLGTILLIVLPSVATFIGGGFGFSAGPAIRFVMRSIMRIGS